MSRTVFPQFCDDIRHEVGNKISLIGCYGSDLLVEDFPVVLPKFCVFITALTPLEKPFTQLIFRAYLNDDLIHEAEVPKEHFTTPPEPDGAERRKATASMTFIPFVIKEAGRLRIEVQTEEETLSGGSIWISKATSNIEISPPQS